MIRYSCIIVFFLSLNVFSQNDCVKSITVCGNSGFSGLATTGAGIQELGNATCGNEETNSIWLKLNFATSGTLAFTLKPVSDDINEDFDFYLFGPSASCANLGPNIRCSTTNPFVSGQANNWTGMINSESDTSEGPAQLGNSFVRSLPVLAGESYYLVIDRPEGFSDFNIEWTGTATFQEPPTFEIPVGTPINFEECDTDGVSDQRTRFDLSRNTPFMIGSQTDVTVTYHLNDNDAITGDNEILDPENFLNTANPQIILARITDDITGCFDFISFLVLVNSALDVPVTTFEVCDDATDGDDTNGSVTFDFEAVTPILFNNQNTAALNIAYYPDMAKANTGLAADRLPRFFYSSSTTVYLSVSNSSGCAAIVPITLNVDSLPARFNFSLVQCDTGISPDGLTTFNLTEATEGLTQGVSNLTATFFENSTTFQNNQSLSETYTNTSNPQQIIVQLTNTVTGCSSLSTLILVVNVIPAEERTIEECDAIGSEDGFARFDLTESNFTVSGTQTIVYYSSLEDALLEQNEIAEDYENTIAYEDTVYGRIEDANDCNAINIIHLVVNKLPNIKTEGEGNEIVCTNLPQQRIAINAGILEGFTTDYIYDWFLDGNVLPQNSYVIYVNKAGTYTANVTNRNGCVKTRTIEVKPSTDAQISSVDIQDITTKTNTVTINLTGTSIGNYEYSIDNPDGPFQESNFFDNVSPGFHEVYVSDNNGCGIISETIAVLGIPPSFSPNGDGFNDYWAIKGINMPFADKSRIYIYDRFGKLVKQIASRDTEGWDGTYEGKALPADDYWYVVHLDDGRSVRGHFALVR